MQRRGGLGPVVCLVGMLAGGCGGNGGTAPVITSTAPATAAAGSPYTYTITATGTPAPAFSVTGLPGWLSFDGKDTITGTPAADDVGINGPVTVTASNGARPDAVQVFRLEVDLGTFEGWRVMPIRSEAEFDQGRAGGEAEQHPHGIARCLCRPDFIYLSHDVAGAWRSTDAGETWRKTLDRGLWVNNGQSIEVDPVDPYTVFLVVDNSWNWLAEGFEGLYRSRDGGDSWRSVLQTDTHYDPDSHRIYRHNIAYDPAGVTASPATTWYVAFPGNGLFRSDDGGDSWGAGPVSGLEGHSVVYAVKTHPDDGRTVYLASSQGLFVSRSRGEGLDPLGDLPGGAVSSVEINPQDPRMIYATVRGQGLYRSTDGGAAFSEVRPFDAARVFMNPGHPDVLYLVGISANTITSHDGGGSWIEDMVTVPAPGLGRDGSSWKSMIAGELSGVAPSPDNTDEAVAFSRATLWKTTDGGHTFVDSSTLFTGFAWSWWNGAVAFDRCDPQRFAFFNNDVGMAITTTGGEYFDRRNDQAWGWYEAEEIGWIGTYSGDFQPLESSQVIVASVGDYFRTKLMHSTDEGMTWQLVPDQLADEMNLFICFHPDDPSFVYAGKKISTDAGATFEDVDFGAFAALAPSILGMCLAAGDTIYAMDADRYYLLRSDDRGASWMEYAHPGWRFKKLDSLPTFAVDPVDRDKVWALSAAGDLAVFDGASWTSTGVLALAGGSSLGNFVRTVAIDPNHPEIVYAGMFSSGIPCVWRSLDGGESWEDITRNLPRTGMSAMAVNPHTGELFKGSCVGTWIFPPPYE